MSPAQEHVDCPNPSCAAPASLGLCTRFTHGFGLQIGAAGPHAARWDDTHCLVCGHFSSPYAKRRLDGGDLHADNEWLSALDRALRQATYGRLSAYLAANDLGIIDLLAMRHAVQQLRALKEMGGANPGFPHVGLLRVAAELPVPDIFGIAHGEGESEPFDRKVRVLGRLLGASAAEAEPRHCAPGAAGHAWFFYGDSSFIGMLCLEPNRTYRGTLTIDGCLDRLLHAS